MESEEIEKKEISLAERERLFEQKIGITWRDKVDKLIDNQIFIALQILIEDSIKNKWKPTFFIETMNLFLKKCKDLVGDFAYVIVYKEFYSILEIDIEDKTYGKILFKSFEQKYSEYILEELHQEAKRHDAFISEPINKEVPFQHKLGWRGYAFYYAMNQLQTIRYIEQVKEDCEPEKYPQTIQRMVTAVNEAQNASKSGIVLPSILDIKKKTELDKFEVCKKLLEEELDRCINANSQPTKNDANQIHPQNKKLTRQQLERKGIIQPAGAFGLMMWYLNKAGVFDKVVSEKMTLNQQKEILAKIGYTTPHALSNVYCKSTNDIFKKKKVNEQKEKVQESIKKFIMNSFEKANYNDDFRKFEPMEKLALMKCLEGLGYISKDLESDVKFKCLEELMTLPQNLVIKREWINSFPCDEQSKAHKKIRTFFTDLKDLIEPNAKV